MAELLRYRFNVGERYAFTQQITVMVDLPQPLADHAAIDGLVEVVQRHPDNSITLQVTTSLSQPLLYSELKKKEEARYHLRRSGILISALPTPPAVPFIVFPRERVAPKTLWKSVENILDRQVAMQHSMGMTEMHEGEQVAHIVSEGTAVGDPAIDFCAVRLFAIERGRPVVQRCITRYIWPERTTTVVVEETARNAP